MGVKRLFWRKTALDSMPGSEFPWSGIHQGEQFGDPGEIVATEPQANLVSSLTTTMKHAPVLDFDFPCKLVPSAREGHFHLYIDKEINAEQMGHLMDGLYKSGLIEEGFYNSYKVKGFTQVRTELAIAKKKQDIARKRKEEFAAIAAKPFGVGAYQVFALMMSKETQNKQVQHPLSSQKMRIMEAVIDLNDGHHWTFEQIADWLETLDIDLNFYDDEGKEVIQ